MACSAASHLSVPLVWGLLTRPGSRTFFGSGTFTVEMSFIAFCTLCHVLENEPKPHMLLSF